jgi:site-specific DNA recombinase
MRWPKLSNAEACSIADVYARKVADLASALNEDGTEAEAAELLRGLADKIVLRPEPHGHHIELVGDLVGILGSAEGQMTKPAQGAGMRQVAMVAGARSANCFAMSKAIIPPCPAIAA